MSDISTAMQRNQQGRRGRTVLKAQDPTLKPAIVLLSGGLDSATTLAIARSRGFACHALSFDYGQRHRHELDAARRVGQHLGVASHRQVKIDTPFVDLTHSALTGQAPVPKDRPLSEVIGDRNRGDDPRQIPVTYVPARNTMFLTYALAAAEVLNSSDIFIRRHGRGLQRLPRLSPAIHRGVRAHGQPRHQGRGRGETAVDPRPGEWS